MELEVVILSKVSQIPRTSLRVESFFKKKDTNKVIYIIRDISGGQDSMLSMHSGQVQSLVWELAPTCQN